MKKIIIILFIILVRKLNAQMTLTSPIGITNNFDYILNRPLNNSNPSNATINRIGHLESGVYGKVWDNWLALGKPKFQNRHIFSNYYGLIINKSSDAAFFGLDSISSDEVNTVISFGDNNCNILNNCNNRLIFRFNSDGVESPYERNIGVMQPNGFIGFGNFNSAIWPSTTLHIRSSEQTYNLSRPSFLRLEQLPTKNCGYILMVDENGYVFRGSDHGRTCIFNTDSICEYRPNNNTQNINTNSDVTVIQRLEFRLKELEIQIDDLRKKNLR